MMNRQGEKWTAVEVAYLYKLTAFTGITYQEASQIMGRSEYALAKRLQSGSLIDDNFEPILPLIGFLEFYRNLKRKRQVVPPDTHFSYKSGKLRKIFSKKSRHVEGLYTTPDNKGHLVPKLKKWQARKKHRANYKWHYYAERAQANSFMQSFIYNREEGHCALCANQLTEADFQIHHADYDHICGFKAKAVIILDKKTPNCEACYKADKTLFSECALRLYAVHGACNKRLSE